MSNCECNDNVNSNKMTITHYNAIDTSLSNQFTRRQTWTHTDTYRHTQIHTEKNQVPKELEARLQVLLLLQDKWKVLERELECRIVSAKASVEKYRLPDPWSSVRTLPFTNEWVDPKAELRERKAPMKVFFLGEGHPP